MPELLGRLQAALADRYRLTREVGFWDETQRLTLLALLLENVAVRNLE